VTEAVIRVVQATKSGRITLEGDPTGYLIAVARNVMLDNFRHRSRRQELSLDSVDSLEIPERSDNAIAAFIDRDAAAADVRRGLSVARIRGDATVFRVVTFVLDEID